MKNKRTKTEKEIKSKKTKEKDTTHCSPPAANGKTQSFFALSYSYCIQISWNYGFCFETSVNTTCKV